VQVLKNCSIVHQIETVVNVEVFFLCQNQSISDKLVKRNRSCEVVKRVTSLKYSYEVYVKHVVLGIIHHVRGKRIKRNHVRNLGFLLALKFLDLFDHISVDYFVTRQEVMPYFFLCEVELDLEFSE
jgi:hypothetical protein